MISFIMMTGVAFQYDEIGLIRRAHFALRQLNAHSCGIYTGDSEREGIEKS
jgi:hypothetical protein